MNRSHIGCLIKTNAMANATCFICIRIRISVWISRNVPVVKIFPLLLKSRIRFLFSPKAIVKVDDIETKISASSFFLASSVSCPALLLLGLFSGPLRRLKLVF